MKDYKYFQEQLEENKEYTRKELRQLAFSDYDIKRLVDLGVLVNESRGVYRCLPKLQQEVTVPEETQVPEETTKEEPPVDINTLVTKGINNIIQRNQEEAINLFNQVLSQEPHNNRALLGLIGAYSFLNDYESVHKYVIEFYNHRVDNLLLNNIYYYLLLLKEHFPIDESLLTSIQEEISNNKETTKKTNQNFKKLYRALDEGNYENALKYINFQLGTDKNSKKYRLTNQIYRNLIMSVLRLKGIDPYELIAQYKEAKGQTFTKDVATNVVPIVTDTTSIPVEEEVVIVPTTKVEETIKVNLLLEAINSNNYELAISLLEEDNIDNPKEVIRTLLTKLSLIKSLITSTEPVKVVSTEPVTVVKEETLLEEVPVVEKQPVVEIKPVHEEKTTIVETSVPEEQPVAKTNEELMQIAYKAYKDTFCAEDFDEALRNLRRYDYLCGINGQKRNINYHYKRIEACKKDFEQYGEIYLQKKNMASEIYGLKCRKKYDEALAMIAEYRKLPGYKSPNIIICEAEIYYARNNFSTASSIIAHLKDSEEPTYFFLQAHLDFKNHRWDDALKNCQEYNERRPHTTIAIYSLMGDIYRKKNKAGKAAKAYRIAQEIAASKGKRTDNIEAKIAGAETQAEFNRSLRLGYNNN